VIPGAVLELAERATRVVMAHVIVIMGVNYSGMRVLMLFVAHDSLGRACLRHVDLLRPYERAPEACALLGQMVPWNGSCLEKHPAVDMLGVIA
jgi:hypothetical protein